MWTVGGKLATSSLINYLPGNKTLSGYSHSVYFGKTSGKFNFNINEDLADDKFNSNDLGYFTNNNFLTHNLYAGYHWTKPTGWYNNIYFNFNATYIQRFKPMSYEAANVNVNANGQLKNLWHIGSLIGFEPEANNFYEPRVPGRVFRGWSDWFIDEWVQTNTSKKYWVYSELLFISRSFFNSKRYSLSLNQNYRFSPKFSVSYSLSLQPQTDNVGFADFEGNDIIFGRRDVQTVENILGFKYSFNDKMGFTIRARHYWSEVDYKQYFTLLPDGGLQNNTSYTGNANQNYNVFTVDAVYTWQFAPGSFMNLVWKNNATTFDQATDKRYFKNFDNTLSSDQNNNLSIKIIYFLDYLDFKKWRKKR